MKINKHISGLATLVLVAGSIASPYAIAKSTPLQHVEVEGLQRISSETVLSYANLKPDSMIHADKSADIIRNLYHTGFFEHVSLTRNGNTVVIHVTERPTIGQLKISGNSIIPTDKLTTVMKSLDIAEGRSYNLAIIDRIKQGMLNQYYQLGRYNARITIDVTPTSRNRVIVKIIISEGLIAKISQINFIGNHAFSDALLTQQLTLSTPGLLTFFTKTDQYSQQKLEASLENIRNFYLDRGYIKFVNKSSQISITPDRKSVFITVVVDEGNVYKVKDFVVSGNTNNIVSKADLLKQIQLKPGTVFSRQDVMNSEKSISDLLGSKGYIFTTINLLPTVNETTKTVSLNFEIKPGKRTYVRHVTFSDNTKTNDEVLRREVQQMESAPVSTTQLDESKRRLNLLPYLRDAQMSVVPVKDQDDLVDINYKVNETSTADVSGRIGYSQVEHILLGAGINQKNFLGTGKTVGLNAETSRYERSYAASYFDPYFTADGVSRSMTLSASHYDPSAANLTKSFSSSEYAFSDVFSLPISQETTVTNRVDIGYGYESTLITLPNDTGNISNEVQSFINHHGRHFQQLDLIFGVSRDGRDKAIFPTRGVRQSLGLNLFLPIGEKSLKYYTLNYNSAWFQPLIKDFIFSAKGMAGYGNSFNGGSNYPFYKNFYSGGMETVRGYAGNTLGPRDNFGNATGGNFIVNGSVSLILPSFISNNVRTSVFFDAGNVYKTADNRVYGGSGTGSLRYSAGVQAEWLTMLGPIDVSLGKALKSKQNDQVEIFQFSLGANFG
jgi:outer membrane protein insertion porin family